MTIEKPARPQVAVVCDTKDIGGHIFHVAGEKYIDAVRDFSDVTPVLLPSTRTPLAAEDRLAWMGGLLLTGALSNVHPNHYEGRSPRENTQLDPQRDATTLELVRWAVAQGLPTLCICRGFQELNVAFGGTLHQHLHEEEGRLDHRYDGSKPLAEQYGPAHPVTLTPGGVLQEILGPVNTIMVNSLHSQGVDRLAPSLKAEAAAEDGTVEAVSHPEAKGFLLGVQWHPEWRPQENLESQKIFSAFGAAVRSYTDKLIS